MKTAFVTDCFLPSFGGIESHIFYLAKAMQKAGAEVHIVTHFAPGDSGNEIIERQENGFRVIRIPGRVIYKFGADIYADFAGYSHLKKLFFREKYDIVHCHTLLSMLVYLAAESSRSLHIPVIVTKHSLNYRFGILNRFLIRFMNIFRFSASLFDGVIGVSKCVLEELGDTGRRTAVIHSGVIKNSTSTDAFESASKEFPAESGVLTVGTVCRLVEMKGIYDFADIVLCLNESGIKTRGIIVGDGPERKNLELYIEKKGLVGKVLLAGRKEHSVIDAYFKTFDIFILASRTEGLGIVILEAMLNGIVSVSTDSGGPSDIIENGVNGYIEKEKKDVCRRVGELWRDNALMQKMRENSVLRAEDFTWENAAKRTEEFYTDVIKKYRKTDDLTY